jgi:deoxyribodipyrimidine photo-lyase
MTTIVHWFRHDLRLTDNRALAAAAEGGFVVPVFILDDAAPGDWAHGGASRWWLNQSLQRLDEELQRRGSRLVLRRGDTAAVLSQLVQDVGAKAVHWTRCYEPWGQALDQRIKAAMGSKGVEVRQFRGSLLIEPEEVRTGSGTPFKVYTPFAKAARVLIEGRAAHRQSEISALPAPEAWPASDSLTDWPLHPKKPDWSAGLADEWTPGQAGAEQRLRAFLAGPVARYHTERDVPATPGTSRLSPHLRFGEISPQACWRACAAVMAERPGAGLGGAKFQSELLWREYSSHLLAFNPNLPDEVFRPEFAAFPWADNPAGLEAWQRGQTGYPIVDAGMRELWHTGWMHNRVRMIVASFLIKDLLVPWQKGEAWFWDTLVDADLANNAAGWQWVAGCGADAAPFFRIFNPVTQGQKFDPDGAYVKRWVPELAQLATRDIHAPWLASPMDLARAGVRLGATYPLPIVDHAKARVAALAAFEWIKTQR